VYLTNYDWILGLGFGLIASTPLLTFLQ